MKNVLVSIAVFILFVMFVIQGGCIHRRVHGNPDEKIWKSPCATIKARKNAAIRLIPLGTVLTNALHILGEPSRRVHEHGDALDMRNIRNKKEPKSYNTWIMEYDFSDGCIVLQFEGLKPTDPWNEMVCTSITIKNNDILTLYFPLRHRGRVPGGVEGGP